jgi:hypothetical protein
MRRDPDDCDLDEPPKHVKKAKKRAKRFGFEEWNARFNKWMHPRWFTTERARDQALHDMEGKTTILRLYGQIPQFRKIDR